MSLFFHESSRTQIFKHKSFLEQVLAVPTGRCQVLSYAEIRSYCYSVAEPVTSAPTGTRTPSPLRTVPPVRSRTWPQSDLTGRLFVVTCGLKMHNGAEREASGSFICREEAGSMMKTTAATPEEEDFILSGLAPSLAQKRLALGVVLGLLVAFLLTAGPLSSVQLARIDAFVPAYASAMFVNDSITAVLLFAQFSILRSRALLAISSGYVFTALMLVPWMLTFPGVFASSGLLGAGLQSTAWLHILWHAVFPAFVIAYALLKEGDPTNRLWQGSVHVAILSSVAMTAGIVCAAVFLVTAGQELLPRLMLDTVHLSALWPYAAGFVSLSSVLAIVVLWARRRSVLDLWLMVVMWAFVIEVCLISFPVPARYSVGWYGGRICGLLSGSLVLFVLLYEVTTLYARQAENAERNRAQEALRENEERLAGEIHDSLAQFFTAISMQLGVARDVIKTGDNNALTYLERASELAQYGLAEARRSAFSLQPTVTEESGLIEALQKVVERSNIPGSLRCNFSSRGVFEESLPPSAQQGLLRIAQEAISNAVRHAKPTVICVDVRWEPPNLVLEVTDNGSGIANPQLASTGGFGLSNMRARAEKLGAQFDVRTAASRGTSIVVLLPIN
jgi:signal transduction histidine kinase